MRQFSQELIEFKVFFHIVRCFRMNHLFLFAVRYADPLKNILLYQSIE